MKRTDSTLNSWGGNVFVVVLLMLAVGCGLKTQTKISSRRDTAFEFPVKSIFVISKLAQNEERFAEAFEDAILSQLERLDIRAKVQTIDPLAVQSDKVRYKSEMVKFDPKAVLVVDLFGGVKDSRKGKIIEQNIKVALFRYAEERKSQHLIWHAEITVKPAGFFLSRIDFVSLARDLVQKLAADGVIAQPSAASPHNNV